MLGTLFLFAYRGFALYARFMQPTQGGAFKAKWALRFSALTDGGLDDDFAEELLQLVREEPGLIDRLEGQVAGDGWTAQKRRMLLMTLRQALAGGAETLS